MPASPTQSRIVSPGPALVHGSLFTFAVSQPAIARERAGKSRLLGNVRAPKEHPVPLDAPPADAGLPRRSDRSEDRCQAPGVDGGHRRTYRRTDIHHIAALDSALDDAPVLCVLAEWRRACCGPLHDFVVRLQFCQVS
jgi:hypothetical protein